MTTSLEALTLHDLEERYNIMSRYLTEMENEINRRKMINNDNTLDEDGSIFNLLTSMSNSTKESSTTKKVKKTIKLKKNKSSIKKEESDSSSPPKIKATIDDMKEALNKNKIKFKVSISRDELEELVRQKNLVRVSVRINKERKKK